LGKHAFQACYPHIRSLSGTFSKYHNGNPRATRAQGLPTQPAAKNLVRPASPLGDGLN